MVPVTEERPARRERHASLATGPRNPSGQHRPRPSGVTFFVEGKLESPLNGRLSRAHWTTKSQWANGWKARTLIAMRPVGRELILLSLEGPKRVTFTAYVGGPWDDDNLPGAIKPCRDQLVHSGVLSGDAPKDGHEFVYRQVVERGRQAKRGVEVTIDAREGA